MLFISGKERVTKMKFSNDTSKTPNIDFSIIRQTKNNFWSSIVSALNISVDSLFLKTTWAEIDYFNPWFIGLFQQDILGLEICMYNLIFMKEM